VLAQRLLQGAAWSEQELEARLVAAELVEWQKRRELEGGM
jgi:hypothetical protein